MSIGEHSASEVLPRLPTGARLVASPACGAPNSILTALDDAAEAWRRWRLYSGLLLGSYPFLQAVADGRLQYMTSHVMPPARGAVQSGLVDFLPIRASQIEPMIRAWATREPVVALVRLTPPDAGGRCSLGVSTAYSRTAVDVADVVVAELDHTMPFTCGDSLVPADRVDHWVTSDVPISTYRQPDVDVVSQQIAQHVVELLPRQPVLQLGIGSVPEAIVGLLAESGTGPFRFVGMAGDFVVDLDQGGHLDRSLMVPKPAVLSVDVLGTERLWRWADRNPSIGMYASSLGHDVVRLAELDRFVSINSAVEIDLSGQVNAEVAGGRQLSGTGGSHDYVEVASHSSGGRSIIALPSTLGDDGASRIVSRLESRAAVTIPRSMVDTVVTEYGVAYLRGASLRERAEALIAIAHPNHRDRLSDEIGHSTTGRSDVR